MNNLRYAFLSFLNECKQTDTRLVLFTQWLLILFLITLTLLSHSIQTFLQGNLDNLLGSDVVVSRYQPLSQAQQQQLNNFATKVSQTQLIPITLTHKNNYQSVQLKVVDNNYPVQGQIATGSAPDSKHFLSISGPAKGEIWLDTRVFSALKLSMGESLEIGRTKLKLTRIIFHEPDRLLEGHSVAMRAMVNASSFSGQSSNASPLTSDRIHTRYLVTTNEQSNIQQWLAQEVPDARFLSKTQSRHPLSSFWQRVENFTGLAAVILFFMAAIAIDIISQRQLKQESYRQALYLSMGLPAAQGIIIALLKRLLGFITAAIPALIIAPILQFVLVMQLQTTFDGIQVSFDGYLIAQTLVLALGILISIQIPSLWQLNKANVMSLIRQQAQSRFVFLRLVWTLVSLSLLAIWYSDNPLLTGLMLTSLSATIAFILLMTYFAFRVFAYLTKHRTGLIPFSIFMMNQRLFSKSIQIMGIGLCVTLLIFTLMLMRDIGEAMAKNQRQNDGNLVITKASAIQADYLKSWSKKNHSPIRQLKPYTSATLIQINGLTVQDFVDHPSESAARLQRPIRLHWTDEKPTNNQILEGQWWPSKTNNWQQISVEEEVMTDLGLSIGDTLSYWVQSKQYDFEIVASHGFLGGQGSVTFWFQVPQLAKQKIAAEPYYMGTMEVDAKAWQHLPEIWQTHPTIGLIPLREMTKSYDDMLAMVTKLVIGFASLLLILALIVIAASVKGFELDEQKKNGLLMNLRSG